MTPPCLRPLTVNPHLQVTSDPADQVGGRPLLAALGRHRLVRADLQQQDLVQHNLPQLRGELCDELQAGREQLPRVSEVLRETVTDDPQHLDFRAVMKHDIILAPLSPMMTHTFMDMQWRPLAMRM